MSTAEPMDGRRASPTLVLLAAGMGSRYGGLKQLEAVGPAGETLMDYSIYDAVRAGFTRVVFVIRPDIEEPFLDFARGRFGGRIEVATVLQRLEDLPAGVTAAAAPRTKPWGTGQAVLAAATAVDGPFAVLNADDFYGRRAFEALAGFLNQPDAPEPPTWSLVGYRLGETASAAGAVNRGVCRADADGWLQGIEEVLELSRDPDGRFTGRTPAGPARFAADATVSMNAWGFTPHLFDLLRQDFRTFLEAEPAAGAEFLLPSVIGGALERGAARVRVLDAGSQWWGMTYPADRPLVVAALRRLVDEGEYPPRLWE